AAKPVYGYVARQQRKTIWARVRTPKKTRRKCPPNPRRRKRRRSWKRRPARSTNVFRCLKKGERVPRSPFVFMVSKHPNRVTRPRFALPAGQTRRSSAPIAFQSSQRASAGLTCSARNSSVCSLEQIGRAHV